VKERGKAVDFEHMFQQSGFITAFQTLIFGSLMIIGVAGKDERFRRVIEKATSSMITFGPMAVLLYVLYSVSHLS